MICKKCGYENPDGFYFCQMCYAELDLKNDANGAPQKASARHDESTGKKYTDKFSDEDIKEIFNGDRWGFIALLILTIALFIVFIVSIYLSVHVSSAPIFYFIFVVAITGLSAVATFSVYIYTKKEAKMLSESHFEYEIFDDRLLYKRFVGEEERESYAIYYSAITGRFHRKHYIILQTSQHRCILRKSGAGSRFIRNF